KTAILNFGTLLPEVMQAAEMLNATVADMRFVKPLDHQLVTQLADTHDLLVTVEENAVMGGAGSAVNEALMSSARCKPVLNIGLPDLFVPQGTQDEIRHDIGLDADGIVQQITIYQKKLQ
ncbi:MAG: transketolase C-terminal domain-containing protein, partial [Plesiomonas sp.]